MSSGPSAGPSPRTGATGLDIEADPNAESFYQHLGGRRVGEVAAPVPGAAERRLPLLVLDEIIR